MHVAVFKPSSWNINVGSYMHNIKLNFTLHFGGN